MDILKGHEVTISKLEQYEAMITQKIKVIYRILLYNIYLSYKINF